MPNMKNLAHMLFQISCTQYFQILFSKEHYSETYIIMEWSHGVESWIGAMEWIFGVEPWNEMLEGKEKH